jgi:pSer/pThr/pTyr-binding forkhead associated (FHA) protein
MPVTVVVRSGRGEKVVENGRKSAFSITFDAPMIVIGRGEGCDVRLPDPSVSHRHATIRQRGSEYLLIDEGSTNGTFMGTVKLGAHAPRILRHGDLARIGRVWIELRFDAPAPTGQTQLATKELALALVARALEAQGETGGPRIVVVEGPDTGKALALDEPARAYFVGRGHEADLVLEDTDASRRHVQIVRRADQVLVRDMASKNGSSLGGMPLATDRDRAWKIGEQLVIGSDLFSYEHPAVEALGELELLGDEKIRGDDRIPPPDPTAPGTDRNGSSDAAAGAAANAKDGGPGMAEPDGGNAPIAEVPRGEARAPKRKRPGAWSGTDLLVVLLAMGVLGLSVLGLFWLFRG